MKGLNKIKNNKTSTVYIDSTLDRYNNVVLFPDKLAKANEQIKKAGFPKKVVNKKG